MNGMRWILHKGIAGMLVMGIALWGAPIIPTALAQLTPETVRECQRAINADPTIDPAVRDICNTEILPSLEEAATSDNPSPEAKAVEAQVETTAVAIADATQATREVLANPDAVVNSTVTALQSNGVPADVVAGVQAQMRDALTRASATLSGGGTVADVAKYFETCQKAMADCSVYLGGKDLKEILAAGGAGFDRPEMATFCAAAFDPSQRDGFQGVMQAHFASSMQEMAVSGALGAEAMRGMMEQMAASGINPAEMMAHAGGEFHGPSPEVIAAMSATDRAMFETWQRGDTAAMGAAMHEAAMRAGMEAGMSPESMAREMATMEAHMREAITVDPRHDSSGTSETTFATQGVTGSIAPSTSPGTTETLVASHDHAPPPSGDGINDEFHYDTNGDGIADHSHTAPH